MRKQTHAMIWAILALSAGCITAQAQESETLQAKIKRLEAELSEAKSQLKAADSVPVESPQGTDAKSYLPESKNVIAESEDSFPAWSYRVILASSAGYDTNVSGLSSEIVRAPGLSHRDSSFIFLNPSLELQRNSDAKTYFNFHYDLQKFYFQEQADANRTTHTFFIEHMRPLGDRDKLGIKATGILKSKDEEGGASQFVIGPELTHSWSDESRWSTSLRYNFQVAEFHTPDNKSVALIGDPDYTAHIVGIKQKYIIHKEDKADPYDEGLSATLGYAFGLFDADGPDNDLRKNSLSLSVKGSPFWNSEGWLHKLSMDMTYEHAFDNYRKDNSRAGVDARAEAVAKIKKITGQTFGDGFEYRRADNVDSFQIVMFYPLELDLPWKTEDDKGRPRAPLQTKIAARYDYSRYDSNLPEQDKDDHVFRLGIVADF